MREKAKRYLGIAQQAGYVIIGSDTLASYHKKLYTILIDSNAGVRNQKNMQIVAENYQIPLCEVQNLAELLDKENIQAIGIKNKGLAQLILDSLADHK